MSAVGTQQRGPITDHFGKGPWTWAWTAEGRVRVRLALCVCKHGIEWPEGDGTHGCEPCIREANEMYGPDGAA